MLSLLGIVSSAGALLGLLRLRVGAVLVASLGVPLICLVQRAEWSLLAGVGFTYVLLSVLQSGYLAGLYAANESTSGSCGPC